MLRPQERSTVFFLFCLIAALGIALESYLVYSMIANGFTGGKAVTVVLNGSILYGIGKVFLKVVSKTFLEPDDVISFSKLHRFASDRCRILDEDGHAGVDDYTSRQRLITEILGFAEESLRGWLPGSHFELCIFVDRAQPLLFAYFDSNRASTARSMAQRRQNPYWYIEQKYEVTKVLLEPSSHPRIIPNTEDKKSRYSFASPQQRQQLRSTMVWCIDVGSPCAIVVSSDSRNAFKESNPEITSFIKFVGTMARFDLFEGGFIHRIRDARPELFRSEAG